MAAQDFWPVSCTCLSGLEYGKLLCSGQNALKVKQSIRSTTKNTHKPGSCRLNFCAYKDKIIRQLTLTASNKLP